MYPSHDIKFILVNETAVRNEKLYKLRLTIDMAYRVSRLLIYTGIFSDPYLSPLKKWTQTLLKLLFNGFPTVRNYYYLWHPTPVPQYILQSPVSVDLYWSEHLQFEQYAPLQ